MNTLRTRSGARVASLAAVVLAGGLDRPYLTIVTYTDWGQDIPFDTSNPPGVVLLQDAFAKLPI